MKVWLKKLTQNNQNNDNYGYLSSKTAAGAERNNADYRIHKLFGDEQETFFKNVVYNASAVIRNHYLEETFSRG